MKTVPEEPVVQAVRETVLQIKAASDSTRIGVAVSGGIDSMVMLHAARHVAAESNTALEVFHVNHGVRASAPADASFVVSLCEQWGIEAHVLGIDRDSIPLVERRGLEADLRELRYKAIADAAAKRQIGWVMVGHHADDVAETMVWRLTRGTSLSGLAGIRKSFSRHDICWRRPLLSLTKQEVRDYAARYAIPYREDETNDDVSFQRNLIRHQVIPTLRRINPRLTETLLRTADILQSEDQYMEDEALKLVQACSVSSSVGYRVNLTVFLGGPIPLQRRAIKILLYCLASEGWSSAHVARVLMMAEGPHPSAEIDIGYGVRAWREYDTLIISQRDRTTLPTGAPARHAVATVVWYPDQVDQVFYGDRVTAMWWFWCVPWVKADGFATTTHDYAHFPRVSSFSIRRPQEGERVRPYGMEGTKKLQDVFTDAKIPQHLRKDWPLVCCDGAVVWVPGLLRCRVATLTVDEPSGWTVHAERNASIPSRRVSE